MHSKYMFKLTEKEMKTILTLAERGPMSGYDLHLGREKQRGDKKAVMSTGSWHKIKKRLTSKELCLIEPVYRSRGRPKNGKKGRGRIPYWLTDEGIFCATVNNASLPLLLTWTRKVKSDSAAVAFLEIVEVIGPKKILETRLIFEAFQEGKLPLMHITSIKKEKAKQMIGIIRKHKILSNRDISELEKSSTEGMKLFFKMLKDG